MRVAFWTCSSLFVLHFSTPFKTSGVSAHARQCPRTAVVAGCKRSIPDTDSVSRLPALAAGVRSACPANIIAMIETCTFHTDHWKATGFSDVKETHQIAEAQQEKNAKLREAFGISEYFVEGSSLDPGRHAREAAARAAHGPTQYQLVRTPSPPPAPDTTHRKRKRKARDRQEPEEVLHSLHVVLIGCFSIGKIGGRNRIGKIVQSREKKGEEEALKET
ncbi:hypothetical protein J6590_064655 [Homalodisca vitripennis]|nr:hypothetical protein J6590_064655 [Homalodisca vitripennis]